MSDEKPDMVNDPPHYQKHPSGVQCIDVIEHWTCNLANCVKYIWRCEEKHDSPIEDLQKAAWYLNREISRRERAAKEAGES